MVRVRAYILFIGSLLLYSRVKCNGFFLVSSGVSSCDGYKMLGGTPPHKDEKGNEHKLKLKREREFYYL